MSHWISFMGITVSSPCEYQYELLRFFHTQASLFQPSSIHGWTLAFLLAAHRLCGVIEGRSDHFPPRWLRTSWQSVITQGKIP